MRKLLCSIKKLRHFWIDGNEPATKYCNSRCVTPHCVQNSLDTLFKNMVSCNKKVFLRTFIIGYLNDCLNDGFKSRIVFTMDGHSNSHSLRK